MLARFSKNVVLVVSLTVALITIVVVGFCSLPREQIGLAASRGQERPRHAIVLDRDQLEKLTWEDISSGRFTWADSAEPQLADLVNETKGIENDATRYLQGLLLIASSKPDEALQVFASIDVEAIPTKQLYAPFRVHDSLRPLQPNPYLPRLIEQSDQGNLPPLLNARVLSRRGRFEEAINAYLATDPKQWTVYDACAMRQISAHSGLEVEIRRVVSAAIAGGRIPASQRGQFDHLLFKGTANSAANGIREQFVSRLKANPKSEALVMASFRSIQDDRTLFLDREYQKLILKHRTSNPEDMTSEMVTMLFLSALSEKEMELATILGQEIKRRHPNPETTQWVENLTQSALRAS